jgi:hypothetical protein
MPASGAEIECQGYMDAAEPALTGVTLISTLKRAFSAS